MMQFAFFCTASLCRGEWVSMELSQPKEREAGLRCSVRTVDELVGKVLELRAIWEGKAKSARRAIRLRSRRRTFAN